MIACVDVDYRGAGAVAACLWFADWASPLAAGSRTAAVAEVADYEPGAFSKRELPCLLAVLALAPPADVVVIDGYVWLAGGAPGLGARLFAAINVPVVGVAKTRYANAAAAVEVCRGESRSPLFVSAAGTDLVAAAESVRLMHGAYRVPTLLREVDSLARAAPS